MISDSNIFQLDKCLKKIRPYNITYLKRYLKDIYREISDEGISKIAFDEYIMLPFFLGEKLFVLMDKDHDNILSLQEFQEGILTISVGNSLDLFKFIFDFLDIDKDGHLIASDIKLILINFNKRFPKNKIEILNVDALNNMVDLYFLKDLSQTLSYKSFLNKTINLSSDLFLILVIFLIKSLPYNNFILNLYKLDKRIENEKEILFESESPEWFKSIIPPSNLELFFSEDLCLFVKISGIDHESIVNDVKKFNKNDILTIEGSTNPYTLKSMESLQGIFISSCSINKLKNDIQINEESKISVESYLQKYNKVKNKLTKVYICLMKKEMFYFKNSSKKQLKGMHYLRNYFSVNANFINKPMYKVIDDINYYYFTLHINNKNREFFTNNYDHFLLWTNAIKQILKINSLDEYDILSHIHTGNNLIVKKAQNKNNGRVVSIKMFVKKEITKTPKKLEMLMKERDILLYLNHKNIISLIDFFEDFEYIHFIFDYLNNGDLYMYYTKNVEINFNERLHVVKQIISGVEYMHSYGVIHRDIKPQNIVMSTNMDVKIIDFQFSSIIGETETLSDPYGTLLFAAPEVLLKRVYQKKVDIWSLGVTIYYIFYGRLLFTDENSFARAILNEKIDINFDDNIYNPYINDLIKDLILKCLEINQVKRFNIKSVTMHELFEEEYEDQDEVNNR